MKLLTYLNAIGFGFGMLAFTVDARAHASMHMLAFDVLITAANLYFVLRDYGTETKEG